MTTAVNDNKAKSKPVDGTKDSNFPNPFRMQHGDVEDYETRFSNHKRARIRHHASIDYLRDAGTIDPWQHSYGVQLMTIWHQSGAPMLKAIDLEMAGKGFNPDLYNLHRMSAADELFKIISFMERANWLTVYWICCWDATKEELGRLMKRRRSETDALIHPSFERLGESIMLMREFKDNLEAGKITPLQAGTV